MNLMKSAVVEVKSVTGTKFVVIGLPKDKNDDLDALAARFIQTGRIS